MRRITRLVVATHNPGKLAEFAALLGPYEIEAVSAATLGLAAPAETADSFAGNARIKAHAAATASGLPALGDDSGLAVDALGGAPGVHTADWAETGSGRDFEMAMRRLHERLQDAPQPWTATFHCTLCLAWPDASDEVFEGRAAGRVVWPARGANGFGYDPVFEPEGHDRTFAELTPGEKHAIDHRARAFAAFARRL